MKPTFQISFPVRRSESQRSHGGHNVSKSPAVECQYQTASAEFRSGGNSFDPSPLTPEFRALSEGLRLADQRNYRLEAGAFVVIIGVAVWPMVMAAQAAFGMLK